MSTDVLHIYKASLILFKGGGFSIALMSAVQFLFIYMWIDSGNSTVEVVWLAFLSP